MTIIHDDNTKHFLAELFESDTNGEEAILASQLSAEDVIDRVNAILGYDLFASQALIEGYREYADEAISLAESNAAAAFEAIPDE
jgi:hypothetical protein